MSRPATPSGSEPVGANLTCATERAGLQAERSLQFPRPPTLRSSSHGNIGKITIGYKLFPTVAEATPPASPVTLQQRSVAQARGTARSRSLDSTVRLAAAQQNAVVKSNPATRSRKVGAEEVKASKSRHMSTVQELPSPAVSIPYSFLPRSSEDAGHMRSSSAPGEYVRDSQTLPGVRLDLSKPQWTSKQAEGHPAKAKGLGLSMPASVSVDCLDHKKAKPTPKARPNLTIEIKHDARMKPKAIGVRGDVEGDKPPPPPPKSPRHDSRNHSLNNIAFEPRKARRTHSRNVSRTSTRSYTSPSSAHPSEGATTISQSNFVKASLVHTPSPSATAPPKPLMTVPKQEETSPLSGDVRIKELMAMSGQDAQDDLERPVPPPITPGRPRVASIGRIVSGPKSVSTERLVGDPEAMRAKEKAASSPPQPKRADVGAASRTVEYKVRSKVQTASPETGGQGSGSVVARTASPAAITAASKTSRSKASKPNLDKPMPAIPPPSSRHSEYMRKVNGVGGNQEEQAPPMPTLPLAAEVGAPAAAREQSSAPVATPGESTATIQPHITEIPSRGDASGSAEGVAPRKQTEPAPLPRDECLKEGKPKIAVKSNKGAGLSAFPSVPTPPQYFTDSPRAQSPAGRRPEQQRQPPADMQRSEPSSAASPMPKSSPKPRTETPNGNQTTLNEPGPPRSRFYGRQPESASSSQVSLVVPEPAAGTGHQGGAQRAPGLSKFERPTKKRADLSRPSLTPWKTPPLDGPTTPLPEQSATDEVPRSGHIQSDAAVKHATPKPDSARLGREHHDRDVKQAPQSVGPERALNALPSARPTSPADLLNKAVGPRFVPGVPPKAGPRSATPDTATSIPDPAETLRFLSKQSEALHARYATLRSERLALSTAISASLRESKPGPEYANLLLDQHLSLNALNSSLDICFAKLKTLDYKKEAAMQELVDQIKEKERQLSLRHRSGSASPHSTKGSVSSKASTPDVGMGHLPTLQEGQGQETTPRLDVSRAEGSALGQQSGGLARDTPRVDMDVRDVHGDSDHASVTDGLPTPRPTPRPDETGQQERDLAVITSPSFLQKQDTAAKVTGVPPAPSLFAKQSRDSVNRSPVSPINDNDRAPMPSPKRITVKGAKAAKILGLVTGRSESPQGITLPDVSPLSARETASKEIKVELKIQRKPLPNPPPAREAPTPPQPGRKLTNESTSTIQTESSPESEVGTPPASEREDAAMMPKGLKIGKKAPAQQCQVVQVLLHDDDILDYYSR